MGVCNEDPRRLWLPIFKTIKPVDGLYVVPVVGVYVTCEDAPTLTSNVLVVLFEIVNHLPLKGSDGLG